MMQSDMLEHSLLGNFVSAVRLAPARFDTFYEASAKSSLTKPPISNRFNFAHFGEHLKKYMRLAFIMAADGTLLSVRPNVYELYTSEKPEAASPVYEDREDRLAAAYLFHPHLKDMSEVRRLWEAAEGLTPRQKNIAANVSGYLIRFPKDSKGGAYGARSKRGYAWQGLTLGLDFDHYMSGSHLTVVVKQEERTLFRASLSETRSTSEVRVKLEEDHPGEWDKLLDIS